MDTILRHNEVLKETAVYWLTFPHQRESTALE